MFGNNVRFKKDFIKAPNYAVNSIFSTMQGEGPFAGTAAIFLRMAQCNLACTFCDTEFEKSKVYNAAELAEAVDDVLLKVFSNPELLVITGGEPLLQDLRPFLDIFFKKNPQWQVQIETAGTVWQESLKELIISGRVMLVCSPKTPTVKDEIHQWCHHWKYIIREGWIDRNDGLPNMPTQPGATRRVRLARPTKPYDTIYVQPVDEQDKKQNLENMKFAANCAMFYNYKLSLQLHKIVGLE